MDLISLLENSKDNLFVTGNAGTGKSTLLREFVKRTRKQVVICAPTGVAAINAGGQTIHSMFKIPPRMINKSEALEIGLRQSNVVKRADIFILDEQGMIRADMMQNLHLILQTCRRNKLPFGGARIIGFGDLYQLPPIVGSSEREHFARDYETPYFFSSEIVQQHPFRVIELTTIFRQSDPVFIDILNGIRSGQASPETLKAINERLGADIHENSVTLCPYNQQVQEINQEMLDRLPGEHTAYKAVIEGDFSKGSYPNDETVFLKPGAQVMLLRNERADGDRLIWVNGTIAIVKQLFPDKVQVQIPRKGTHHIEFSEWESIRYEYAQGQLSHRVSGSFQQIPMKLAAAFSVHKSQGKTFDAVRIDMGRGAFDFGQTYVALSRCRTLEGISLTKPIRHADIMIDERIPEYLRRVREAGLMTEISQEFDARLA